MNNLTDAQKEDLLVGLATLVLHDGGLEVTSDSLMSVITASGNKVQAYWGGLVAKALAGKDLDDVIMKPGQGGGPAAGGAAAGGDAGEAAAAEPEPESEGESAGGAGGLFDDDEDDW
eukprot:537511_1